MELQITGKNIELTAEVRQYIERKLGRLNRHLPDITDSKVEIFEEKTKSPQQRFVVQMTVDSHGTLLRSEERGEDLFSAADRVAATMNRQIERFKGKLSRKGKGNSLVKGVSQNETTEMPPSAKVVKIKRFTIKPMSATEAVSQMELLGHNFFLFFNADSEQTNVVYRRKDGDYGLIEPELG
jgi:putative sigma-54 modulation protein